MRTVLYFQSGLCESNTAKLEGAYRYAKTARWHLQVVPYAEAVRGREQVARLRAAPDIRVLVDFWNPSGAIVDAGSSSFVLSIAAFKGLPTVFLDSKPTAGSVCITSNAAEIADVVAKELMKADCAAYGYVPFEEKMWWSVERGVRFAEFIRLNGRKCHLFRMRRGMDDSGTYRRWLSDWLKRAPRPFGVFAANDYTAQTVLSCAARVRIKVPDELRVVGVDNDIQICEHSRPPLTSVILDFEAAGYLAAESLMERILHPRKRIENRTFGVFGIQHRLSTAVFRRHDDRVCAAVEYIRRNSCRTICTQDVVAVMRCSRRLAEMRFREVTGRSIGDEIRSVRLEYAKYLLAHTKEPVSAVAARCGYASAEPLRRLFLSATGLSPLKWRKR